MNLAIILSGGTGLRMNTDTPKQYLSLAGKPILVYTTEQFQCCSLVDFIIIVAAKEWESTIWAWKEQFELSKVCAIALAGENRQESILNGLLMAQELSGSEQDGVIIQDAVRPLTSKILIQRLLEGLNESSAVLPVLPVTDTVYVSADGQNVGGLLERSSLYAGQAPEAFNYKKYLELYASATKTKLDSASGSCQLPYQAGWNVKMIPGERDNIKVTYQEDIAVCEQILQRKGRQT